MFVIASEANMLATFTSYFQKIEMPKAVIERAEEICNTFSTFIPQPIEKVFVSDAYEQPSQIRRYDSLWLHAGGKVLESKKFLVSSNIDVVSLKTGVGYIEISAVELSSLGGSSTPKSVLKAEIMFRNQIPATLSAAHSNCAFLAEFISAVFMPHLG
jgi:hypothetical protein